MALLIENIKSRYVYVGAQGKLKKSSTNYTPTFTVLDPGLLPLYGVTKIRLTWSRDIGIRQGLSVNFLQPWYNKPVEIEIEGTSYIGIYGGTSVDEEVSKTKESIPKAPSLGSSVKGETEQFKKEVFLKWKAKTPSWAKAADKLTNKIVAELEQRGPVSKQFKDGLMSSFDDFIINIEDIKTEKDIESWVNKIYNELSGSLNNDQKAVFKNLLFNWSTFTFQEVSTLSRKGFPSIVEQLTKKDVTANDKAKVEEIQKRLRKEGRLLQLSHGPKLDENVDTLKLIISKFSWGPFSQQVTDYSEIRHVLIIENEKGSSTNYSMFYGYIKNLTYTEEIGSPFIYAYTLSFVGLPAIGETLKESVKAAIHDKTSMGVTITNSGKIFLQQGLGIIAGKSLSERVQKLFKL